MCFKNDKSDKANSLVRDWFDELVKLDKSGSVTERDGKIIFTGFDTNIEFSKSDCGLNVSAYFNPMVHHNYDVELFFDDIKLLIGDLEYMRLGDKPTYLVPAGKIDYFGVDANGYLALVDREHATKFTKEALDHFGLSDYKLEKVG